MRYGFRSKKIHYEGLEPETFRSVDIDPVAETVQLHTLPP